MYDFENKKIFFKDVHASFKFNVFIASPKRIFDETKCAFYLHSVKEMADPERCFPLAASDFAKVNPNTGTAPVFRTRRDASLTAAIYSRMPILVDRSNGREIRAWPVKYVRMFDMTNDSHLFRTRLELEEKEGAYPVGGNRFKSPSGDWLPLYTGRMINQYDHRAASVKVNEANLHNAALSDLVSSEEKADPAFFATPQYWVPAAHVDLPAEHEWVIAFRDIARATDVRTMIAAAVSKELLEIRFQRLFLQWTRSIGKFAPLVANVNPHITGFYGEAEGSGSRT